MWHTREPIQTSKGWLQVGFLSRWFNAGSTTWHSLPGDASCGAACLNLPMVSGYCRGPPCAFKVTRQSSVESPSKVRGKSLYTPCSPCVAVRMPHILGKWPSCFRGPVKYEKVTTAGGPIGLVRLPNEARLKIVFRVYTPKSSIRLGNDLLGARGNGGIPQTAH